LSLFIVIGARGWNHPEWRQSYYPGDLPDDWKLSFYSHTFHAVLVPWQDWRDVDDAAAWLEDVDDEFRFFFELPQSRLTEQHGLGHFYDQLGQNWGGVIVTGDGAAEHLPGGWRERLPDGIVELDGQAAGVAEGAHQAWRPGRECKGSQTGFIGDELEPGNLRTLKDGIMAFMTQAGDDGILYLFVEGDGAPAIKLMQDAVAITEILGVA
jgi:hypothetical protein